LLVVNLVFAALIYQGSKIWYKKIVIHKIEQQSVTIHFRDVVAVTNQSHWIWPSGVDGAAGGLGGVERVHF
jgi:hypothetical protein